MNISLNWLNRYLAPGGVSAEEADRILTFAGYPVEGIEKLDSGDTLLDVELTSNRGDLLSHIGCAREIVAADESGSRKLDLPSFEDPTTGEPIGSDLTLQNDEPSACPLFTARLIRNVKVGPSPVWLVELLEAVGQRSINNVVDVTNFITHEFGNPCHVFDLKKLAGGALVIRYAHEGETLTTLDGKTHTLIAHDLVVADSEKPTSLAGVMGGHASEVDESTTDVVFEMATWDPVVVRNQARRLNIRTDASHRFERIVDPRTIESAARRAVQLICELTGGELAQGVLSEGRELPETEPITLRLDRASRLLGIDVHEEEARRALTALDIKALSQDGGVLSCTPPPARPDLEREIDLIEELARVLGYERVPEREKIELRVRHPQESERARRELHRVLTGLGFYETVTFSFVSTQAAGPWLQPGMELVGVDDDRRGSEPILRPSTLPSLLTCRKANAAGQVQVDGGVRLYEMSAVFAQTPAKETIEHRKLGLLVDVEGVAPGKKAKPEQLQAGVRTMRGAIEHIIRAMAGAEAQAAINPAKPSCDAWQEGAFGEVILDAENLGVMGLVEPGVLKAFGVDTPVVGAELDLDALVRMYPPKASVSRLPAFPAIERDLSLVLDESTHWAEVEGLVRGSSLEHFESLDFVGAFRGGPVGEGKKSVTLRLRFRHPAETLRHDDVDPQVEKVVQRATQDLGAVLRS